MAGKTVFLLLAVAVLIQATPQILTFNGKIVDPANIRQSFGQPDLARVNGLDSAVFYTPSKEGLVSAGFITGATVTLTGRGFQAGVNYYLYIAGRGMPCRSTINNNDPAVALSAFGTLVATDADGVNTVTFLVPTSATVLAPDTDWNSRALHWSVDSRKICLASAGAAAVVAADPAKWTGATLKATFDCTSRSCTAYPVADVEFQVLPVALKQAFDPSVRNTCCSPSATSAVPAALRVSVCINPRVQTCCGATPVGPAAENTLGTFTPVINKCCSTATETLVDDVNPCPCRSASTLATPAGQTPGLNSDCPNTNQRCCLPSTTRYPELTAPLGTERVIVRNVFGSCFDPADPVWKCCVTGQLYNSGTSRCCLVGGVQSLDVPCSCTTDDHCAEGRCCTSTNPDRPVPKEADRCSIYQSYPYSPNAAQVNAFGVNPTLRTSIQNCYGSCINPNFQSCCNGVICQRAYEKCCNSTCCNKFSETCIEGQRSTSSQFNTNSFRTTFYTCSSIELLTVLRSGMIYIIPLALLIATFGGLGVVLVFANKASNRSYSFIESTMIVLALVSALASVPLFFSPMFKYAVFIIVASLISILSAAARVQIVNVFAIIAQVVILFYIFDPIHGNRFLTFTSFPQLSGTNMGLPDTETKGLLHTTTSLFYRNGVVDTSFCTTFYDYFNLDKNARDTARFDNPDINTFGYCKRGWIAFLLIFEGILIVAFVLLFIVSLISLLLRFRKAVNLAPITLEILKEDAPFTPVPLY